jgi:hypothetical protein
VRPKKLHTASPRQSNDDRLLQARAAGTRVQDADGDASECSSVATNQLVSIMLPRMASQRGWRGESTRR